MMTNNMNLTQLNETQMDLYLKPSKDWHIYEEGFEVSPKLNFTWKVVEFDDDLMAINLTFSSAIDISPKVVRDSVVIHFKNASQWLRSADGTELDPEYLTIYGEVPK